MRFAINIGESESPGERYDAFSRVLIDSPNFQYGIEEMANTARYLLDSGFSLRARYHILGRITRRASMSRMLHKETMGYIWKSLDNAGRMGEIESAIGYAGLRQVYIDLLTMHYVFTTDITENIAELERRHKMAVGRNGIETKESLFLAEAIESHNQLTSADMRITQDLIEKLYIRLTNLPR